MTTEEPINLNERRIAKDKKRVGSYSETLWVGQDIDNNGVMYVEVADMMEEAPLWGTT